MRSSMRLAGRSGSTTSTTTPSRPPGRSRRSARRAARTRGPTAAAIVIHDLLVERLALLADRHRFPIAEERIERPIIAFGEPRSGTTVLQMLLGCDPGSRLLRVLGGDAPVAAAWARRSDRPSPPRRRRVAGDPRPDPEVAGVPPLQRHARVQSAGVRAAVGVRLPRPHADRLVARPRRRSSPRSSCRRTTAVSTRSTGWCSSTCSTRSRRGDGS